MNNLDNLKENRSEWSQDGREELMSKYTQHLDNLQSSLSECSQEELEELKPVFMHTKDRLLNMLKKVLKPWLAERWKKDNAPKYQKYFEEWFSNITEDQALGFYDQMITKL